MPSLEELAAEMGIELTDEQKRLIAKRESFSSRSKTAGGVTERSAAAPGVPAAPAAPRAKKPPPRRSFAEAIAPAPEATVGASIGGGSDLQKRLEAMRNETARKFAPRADKSVAPQDVYKHPFSDEHISGRDGHLKKKGKK